MRGILKVNRICFLNRRTLKVVQANNLGILIAEDNWRPFQPRFLSPSHFFLHRSLSREMNQRRLRHSAHTIQALRKEVRKLEPKIVPLFLFTPVYGFPDPPPPFFFSLDTANGWRKEERGEVCQRWGGEEERISRQTIDRGQR